ncbi:MAG: DNA primase small subunit domain-containing protein, partial [Nanoarchaeota archaeon]
MGEDILKYYNRKDVQKRMVECAQHREIAIRYPDGNFGKRPNMLQYENEVYDLAKKGAVSFHFSEEYWSDPLQLKPAMNREELNRLRTGFDIIFDIDCKFIEYSKRCAMLIKELLEREGIRHVHTKFTGSTGFHIGITFASLPIVIEGREVKTLFPEMVREAAGYVKEKISKDLAAVILDLSEWREIADATGKEIGKLKDKEGRFNPFSVIEIDSVAISSRHMIRSVYSVNEKSGRISIPVKNPMQFNLRSALIPNVETSLGFLDTYEEGEAKNFLDNVFMCAYTKQQKKEIKEQAGVLKSFKMFEVPKIAIKDENKFPPCIKLLLLGAKEDGRKRAVFILINFFLQLGWNLDDVEKTLMEWNKKNYEPLREGYIRSQINWFKKQESQARTPSCSNEAYMVGIGICKPDGFCKFIKTPAHYALKR